jgi:transposase
MAAQDGAGEVRRTRSLDERRRIVEEALAPGVSVAAVARRHGVNANLVFKWIRRSREGWRDRRREPAKEKSSAVVASETIGPTFVPVKLLELSAASAPSPTDVVAKPVREARRSARPGAMVISFPSGAKVSLDAEVDAEALRRVLSALGVV